MVFAAVISERSVVQKATQQTVPDSATAQQIQRLIRK
jgi:hypothetical protein